LVVVVYAWEIENRVKVWHRKAAAPRQYGVTVLGTRNIVPKALKIEWR
jgi:hypothetical protein